MTKSIWIPKSELKVTVSNGEVHVWDEMTMQEKPLSSKPAGFAQFVIDNNMQPKTKS